MFSVRMTLAEQQNLSSEALAFLAIETQYGTSPV